MNTTFLCCHTKQMPIVNTILRCCERTQWEYLHPIVNIILWRQNSSRTVECKIYGALWKRLQTDKWAICSWVARIWIFNGTLASNRHWNLSKNYVKYVEKDSSIGCCCFCSKRSLPSNATCIMWIQQKQQEKLLNETNKKQLVTEFDVKLTILQHWMVAKLPIFSLWV